MKNVNPVVRVVTILSVFRFTSTRRAGPVMEPPARDAVQRAAHLFAWRCRYNHAVLHLFVCFFDILRYHQALHPESRCEYYVVRMCLKPSGKRSPSSCAPGTRLRPLEESKGGGLARGSTNSEELVSACRQRSPLRDFGNSPDTKHS